MAGVLSAGGAGLVAPALAGAAVASTGSPDTPPAPPAGGRLAPAPGVAQNASPPPSPLVAPAQRTASRPSAEAQGEGCDPAAAAAERALLETLRARRQEIDRREKAAADREMLVAAAESRLTERVDALAAMQARLEAAEQARGEREEAGWRQMVKLYEGMRPRDAAAIFDDLDMPVLVQILQRMGERKAAPVLGAMRPDRARLVTAELARSRTGQPPQ